MINFSYFANTQNAAPANREQETPRISRPSDKTIHLVQEILNNSPNPVLFLKNSAGQTLYQAPYTLEAVPETERQSIVQLAHLLITDRMHLGEISEIYTALANILPSERVLMVQYALSLTTDNMEGWEKALVIRTIQNIPENLRANLVQHAKFLITASMNGEEVEDILKAVRDLPADERKNVVSLVNSLINQRMIGIEVLAILNNLKNLPADERTFIVQQAHHIITSEMEQSTISRVLDSLQALSEDELLAKQASPLFTEQMDPQTRIDVMTAIANVLPSERNSIIDLTIQLIPSDIIAIKYRIDAIQVLHSIPKEQRKNAVNLACASQDVVRRIELVQMLAEKGSKEKGVKAINLSYASQDVEVEIEPVQALHNDEELSGQSLFPTYSPLASPRQNRSPSL